jgi:hypothetical protein
VLLADAAQNGMAGHYGSVPTASFFARRSSSGRRRSTGSGTDGAGGDGSSSPSR